MQTRTMMPEMDWLTGLSSRASFGRHVTQADRDGDRFAIALIEIEDVGRINRRLDYAAGDELLRAVGRALAFQTSVNTFAARLGGARFALLTVRGLDDDDLGPWLAPIVGAVEDAIAGWAREVLDYDGDRVIEPDISVGASVGDTGRVWSDAAVALDLASGAPTGGTVVLYDPNDPRVLADAGRRRLAENIVTALDNRDLMVGGHHIGPTAGDAADWRWLRLGPLGSVDPGPPGPADVRTADTTPGRRRTDPKRQLIDVTTLDRSVRRRVDDWLIDRAVQMLGEAVGQMRFTVPISGQIKLEPATAERLGCQLERGRVPTSRLLLEVDEHELVDGGDSARDFCRMLDRIGSGLVIGGCGGGWAASWAGRDLPIFAVVPDRRLIEQAADGARAAARILGTLADNAADQDHQLIAPHCLAADTYLADLGFTYREQPATVDAGTGRPIDE